MTELMKESFSTKTDQVTFLLRRVPLDTRPPCDKAWGREGLAALETLIAAEGMHGSDGESVMGDWQAGVLMHSYRLFVFPVLAELYF